MVKIAKCKQCNKEFYPDEYDEPTAHGWFCSGKCLETYAQDTQQTFFMVIHGCGPNSKKNISVINFKRR